MSFKRLTPSVVIAMVIALAMAITVAPALPAQSTAAAAAASAEVTFVQRMIMHHAQALTMSAMVRTRTMRPELLLLAERIEVSQQDEIAVMQRWLEARRAPAMSHEQHGAHEMPGILTAVQLEQLADARDATFDRLFLRFMIQHHDGAIVMVDTLRRVPGAAQEPMLFQFVNDIDADQRAEIRRMQALLAKWP